MTPGGGSLERAIVDWNALIDEYGPVVVRISWRILGNGADVEDNVQEVFFEAFRFHNRETVRHWGGLLRRLATIGALAKLRRRRHELSLEVVGQPACESRPEEGPIARELEARLRRAVAALPEREGAVFSLRCFEGLELPEIAAALGIKYSAAATALSRARAKLEAVFAETAVEET
jgi:RNA polymerase sigma-70 factor (ECF subfamily)